MLGALTSPLKSRLRIEAENGTLPNQLIALRRRLQGRIRLTNHDSWFFIQLYRWFPHHPRPETLGRWHRASFRYCGEGRNFQEVDRKSTSSCASNRYHQEQEIAEILVW
jgi:hypothetical protein